MKNKILKWCAAFVMGLNFFVLALPAEAFIYYRNGYYRDGYYRPVPARTVTYVYPAPAQYVCKSNPGYWSHGYWHPAERVCYYHY